VVVDDTVLDDVCNEGPEENKVEMALVEEEWFDLFVDLPELSNSLEVSLEERVVAVVLIKEVDVEALVGSDG